MADEQPAAVKKLPIPPLPASAYSSKKRKRRKTLEEKKDKQREFDRARNKTRINIGAAFRRWRELRDQRSLKTDADLALFLLDRYEGRSSTVPTPTKRRTVTEPIPPVSTSDGESPSDREDDFGGLDDLDFSEDEETSVQVYETNLTAQDIDDGIDEEYFNHIQNSIIDWAEDRTWCSGEDTEDVPTSEEDEESDYDGSDDEEDIPPLCVRTGGAIKTKICLDALQSVSMEDTVHDAVDPEPMEQAPIPEKNPVQSEDDVIGHPASITYHVCLTQLAEYLLLPIKLCIVKECQAPGPFKIQTKSRGSAVIVQWFCPNNHCVWQWNSQPTFKCGMQACDFMLASNIILSGNSYAKVALLFKFMNVGIVDRTTFFKIQDTYCVDAVKDFWNNKRAEVVSKLQSKDSVVVLADGLMDSPGFCTQYCTYTLMENDTKEILSIVNVDKREAQRRSVIMEREGFIRSFDMIRQEVKLAEICTDAHSQISALFNPCKGKYKDSGVLHTLDMWHGSKNLGKKIHAAGQLWGCSILLQWNKDICNHFWYCCKTAENYDDFFDMWTGLLNHVTGERELSLDSCQHGPLEEDREKGWIEKGSVAHEVLSEIILSERWLKEVHKYLQFRSTAELESFHNHILMYASKPFSFSPPVYEARILLAGLDYNHHVHRAPRRRPDGSIEYRKLFNKKSRKWSLYAIKEEKDYSYIPDLQRAIIRKRVSSCRQHGVSKGEGPHT